MWGFLLQMIFALIVLRTSWGYDAFDWLGKRVTEFLDHTDNGARFVFGDGFMEHFFAFKVNALQLKGKALVEFYFETRLRMNCVKTYNNLKFCTNS